MTIIRWLHWPAAFALAAALADPALAQIYRWVDEKGVTHYEEKPGAKSARPVDLADPTGGPKPAEPAPATTRTIVQPDGTTITITRPTGETALQRQEREFQERQARRHSEIEETDRQRSAIAARAASRRRASCENAQRQLAATSLRYPQQRRYYQDIASRDC
jgi:uncharacterized protein DUF4124